MSDGVLIQLVRVEAFELQNATIKIEKAGQSRLLST